MLAVGTGFPGWWGYYPGIISSDEDVASIVCEQGRSLIPFREPGIVFGGERCYLKAKEIGVAWLLTGNKYTLYRDIKEVGIGKLSDNLYFSANPESNNRVIKVRVMPDTDN